MTSDIIRFTTNYGFPKPPFKVEPSVWERQFNDAMDAADAAIKAIADLKETTTGLSSLTDIPKGDGVGNFTAATPGVDYQPAPSAGGGPIASSATPTPAVGTAGAEIRYYITALAEAATFGAPTGTPTQGQVLKIWIVDNGTARDLAFNAGAGGYLAGNQLPLPTTTILSELMVLNFTYNSTKGKWLYTGALGGF